MKEIIDLEDNEGVYSLKARTSIYNLIKPGQDDFYNVDDMNSNMDIIEGELDKQSKQITDLSSPYVIPEGKDIPIKDRKKGKMYFKVTSRQSGGGVNDTVKVSPMMGLKIQ